MEIVIAVTRHCQHCSVLQRELDVGPELRGALYGRAPGMG